MDRILIIFSLLLSSSAFTETLTIKDACTNSEALSLPADHAPRWAQHYQAYRRGNESELMAFSQAIYLKRLSALLSNGEFERGFSEYWVGRVAFDFGLDPLAVKIFHSIVRHSKSTEIRKAALSCLIRVQHRSPDWALPIPASWIQVPFNLASEADAEVIYLLSQIKNQENPNRWSQKLPSPYLELNQGKNAAWEQDHKNAVKYLSQVIRWSEEKTLPQVLEKEQEYIRLLLSHSLYSLGKHTTAIQTLQKIKKSSNLEIDALSDLTWMFHRANEHDASIGIALQIRSGTLKHAFAPEPLMVAAISLNELCMFPDSIRFIRAFEKNYASTYEWLRTQNNIDLYSEAVKVLKGTSTVPSKVGSEWLKTPEFLTRQMELNALITHPKRLKSIREQGAYEQNKLGILFIQHVEEFKKEYQIAKLKLKPGEVISPKYGLTFQQLKRDFRELKQFYRAAKSWKTLSEHYQSQLPTFRKLLVSRVNRDLHERNQAMLSLLEKVKKNLDLVEVEIYNGASQDLIWKNAHPEFETLAESLDEKMTEIDTAQTWNWGRVIASEIESAEVWEDEIGALRADLANRCDQKDRYLKIQLSERMRNEK